MSEDCIVDLVTVLWSGDVLISKLLVEVGTIVVRMTSRVWGVVGGGVVSSGKLSVRELFCMGLVRVGVFCSDIVHDMSKVEEVSEEELSSMMP